MAIIFQAWVVSIWELIAVSGVQVMIMGIFTLSWISSSPLPLTPKRLKLSKQLSIPWTPRQQTTGILSSVYLRQLVTRNDKYDLLINSEVQD